jgi:hypothetical protein
MIDSGAQFDTPQSRQNEIDQLDRTRLTYEQFPSLYDAIQQAGKRYADTYVDHATNGQYSGQYDSPKNKNTKIRPLSFLNITSTNSEEFASELRSVLKSGRGIDYFISHPEETGDENSTLSDTEINKWKKIKDTGGEPDLAMSAKIVDILFDTNDPASAFDEVPKYLLAQFVDTASSDGKWNISLPTRAHLYSELRFLHSTLNRVKAAQNTLGIDKLGKSGLGNIQKEVIHLLAWLKGENPPEIPTFLSWEEEQEQDQRHNKEMREKAAYDLGLNKIDLEDTGAPTKSQAKGRGLPGRLHPFGGEQTRPPKKKS